mmetsp:Transcript_28146/g.65777  ORF Transcript_28146/g.65777 Transcript_28146/m.65777 type:complete len:210 (-) Transcript_28146:148-777(-)
MALRAIVLAVAATATAQDAKPSKTAQVTEVHGAAPMAAPIPTAAPARAMAASPTPAPTTTTTPGPSAPPGKEECKTLTTAALDSAGVSWRFGGWEYGRRKREPMWPGGAIGCHALCEADAECMHWEFSCNSLACGLYGKGGYEEDGDPQFGRDFQFLGDSTHHARRLEEQKTPAPVGGAANAAPAGKVKEGGPKATPTSDGTARISKEL